MIRCINCHKDNPESAQFCGHCGAKLLEYEAAVKQKPETDLRTISGKETDIIPSFSVYSGSTSGSALDRNQPWRQGDYPVVVFVTLFVPLIGILLGALKLKYQSTNKQSFFLILWGLVSLPIHVFFMGRFSYHYAYLHLLSNLLSSNMYHHIIMGGFVHQLTYLHMLWMLLLPNYIFLLPLLSLVR